MERLQKRLEDTRKIAIMNPTESNVLRYMELEAKVVRQASYFADVAQRLGWTHSQLDLTLEGRPVNALAIQTYNQQEQIAQARTIADLAKDHVIFFFFRDCPYCHTYAPILKAFAEQNGMTVVPVSLDGGGLPEFPTPRQDNGIARTLNVDQVPATFLAQPEINMRIQTLRAASLDLLRGTMALLASFSLAFAPLTAYSADLNTEVNNMFNNLGAMSNYTAPGAFKGQVYNTYAGGSFYMRSPNKTYQFSAVQFPMRRVDAAGSTFSRAVSRTYPARN